MKTLLTIVNRQIDLKYVKVVGLVSLELRLSVHSRNPSELAHMLKNPKSQDRDQGK